MCAVLQYTYSYKRTLLGCIYMENYLCIIRQDEDQDWYLLCVRHSFFCMSAGPLHDVKQSIRNIKRRYKTVYGLEEALRNLSEPAKVAPNTFEVRKQVYNAQKGRYDHILSDIMKEEYARIKEKKKPKKSLVSKKAPKLPAPAPQPVKKVTLPAPKKKPVGVKKPLKLMKAKK